MKYSRSRDGIMRATLHAEARMEADEVATVRKYAAKEGVSVKEFMSQRLKDGLYGYILHAREDELCEQPASE